MRRFMVRTLSIGALVGGCESQFQDGNASASGAPIYQAFDFDTLRTWAFISDDDALDYRLRARQLPDPEDVDGEDVHTIEFQYDCINDRGDGTDTSCAARELEGTQAFAWAMSSSLGEGVLVHRFSDTVFDPPVQLAEGRMLKGESVTSSSGGVDYTATYVDVLPCPAERFWPDPDNRAECYQIDLTASGPSPIAGTYYVAARFTYPAFRIEAEGGRGWEMIAPFDEIDD